MKVNQVINIDKAKEKDYNKVNLTNEATFTYYSKDMQENLLIKIQNLFSRVLGISFQIKKFRLLDFILEKRLKKDLMKLPKEKEFEN